MSDNRKISELAGAQDLTGNEVFELVQNGENRQANLSDILAWIQEQIGAGSGQALDLMNTSDPVIAGNTDFGDVITGIDAVYNLSPLDSLTYQWFSNDVAISGATSAAYMIEAAVQGTVLVRRETATKDGASITTQSNALSIPAAIVEETHVLILAGQSNMVGRPSFDGGQEYPAGTLQLAQDGSIIAATSPLDHVDEQAGDMGLALQFVIDYKAANPNANVVLVPAAEGGTSFSAGDWIETGPRYTAMVSRHNAMMAANPDFMLKGVLWHQGENDAAPLNPTYQTELDALITRTRTDLTGADASTPFVMGEMVHDWVGSNQDRNTVQNIIKATPQRFAHIAVASAASLEPLPDGIHFNAAALRTLGSRYHSAYNVALSRTQPVQPPSQAVNAPDLIMNPGAVYETAQAGFGQRLTQWYGQTPENTDGLSDLAVGTAEAVVTMPAPPGGTKTFYGQGSTGWAGVDGEGYARAQAFGVDLISDRTITKSFIADGATHTVAVSFGPTASHLFVDGVIVASAAGVSPAAGTGKFTVGSASFGLTDFQWTGDADNVRGTVNELSIWSTQRTEEYTPSITPFTGCEPNLLALWHLNENGNAAGETISVSDNAELLAALAASTGDEIIELAPGVNFGTLSVDADFGGNGWARFDSKVTIKSESSDNPASFESVILQNANNWHFEDVDMNFAHFGTSEQERRYRFEGNDNIVFRKTRHTGSNAFGLTNAAGNGFGSGQGLNVSDGSNILIDKSRFSTWWRSAAFSRIDGLTIIDADVTDARSDGFVLQEVQNVLIARNHIHNFRGEVGTGDHVDAIQFQNLNTTEPSSDVIIEDNVIDVGDGTNFQAIFTGSEASNLPRYQGITVRNNFIRTDSIHAITIENGINNTIENNTILQRSERVDGSVPQINASEGGENYTIRNNVVPFIAATHDVDGHVVQNNIISQRVNRLLPDYYDDLFANAIYGGVLKDFTALPGGRIVTENVGSTLNRYNPNPEDLTAIFHTDQVSETSFDFDATLTADASGAIGEGLATFTWSFGDGSPVETGISVTHDFVTSGTYSVTLTVVHNDGRRDTATASILIPDELLMSLTASGGSGSEIATLTLDFTPDNPIEPTGAVFEQDNNDAMFRLQSNSSLTVPASAFSNRPEYGLQDGRRHSWTMKGQAGDDGHLFDFSNRFDAAADAAGNVTYRGFNDNNEVFTVTSSGVNFLDGQAHNVSAVWDSGAGTLTLFDGATQVGQVPITGLTRELDNRSMIFGLNSAGNIAGATVLFDDFVWVDTSASISDGDQISFLLQSTTSNLGATADYILPSYSSGDLVVGILRSGGTGIVIPAGWNNESTAANPEEMLVMSRRMDGSEGGSLSISQASGQYIAITWYVLEGASGNIEVASSTPTNSVAVDFPSITPSWGEKDTAYIIALSTERSDRPQPTEPIGYTDLVESEALSDSTSSSVVSIWSSRKIDSVVTEDPGAYVSGGSFRSIVAMTIAIEGS